MENKESVKGKAVGYHKNDDGTYTLVTVEYDPETNKAEVVGTKPCGDHSLLAVDEFKKMAVELGLVR